MSFGISLSAVPKLVICEGCRDSIKEVKEKMEVISDRIFKEYTERLNDEDWYFNDPLYDAFHSERTKEWSPLLSQVPVPWKFREESENGAIQETRPNPGVIFL